MKILLIQETLGSNRILVRALARDGASVQEAQTGSPAVVKASEFQPDVILIDSRAGDGDALRTATTLGWVHGVPIVFLVSAPARGLRALLVQLPWVRAVLSRSSGLRQLLEIVAETARSSASPRRVEI